MGNVLGWLGQKLSLMFKGPWGDYFAEVHEGRKSVIWLIRLRGIIAHKIPEKAVKEHDITKVIKLQKKAVKLGKGISKKDYLLFFRVELDIEREFETIHKVVRDLEKARHKLEGRDKASVLAEIEIHVLRELIDIMLEEKKSELNVYWKYLEPVIASTSKRDRQAKMAEIVTMMKTKDISRLAVIACRWEARATRRSNVGLEHNEKELKTALRDLGKPGKQSEEAVNRLKAIDKQIVDHAKNGFRSTFLLMKRDLLWDLVLLRFLNMDRTEMEQFVGQRLMPREPEFEHGAQLDKIKKDIANHCHVMAQGLRRLVAKDKDLVREAEKEIAEAKRMAGRRRPPKIIRIGAAGVPGKLKVAA